jgi:hypothetical protein
MLADGAHRQSTGQRNPAAVAKVPTVGRPHCVATQMLSMPRTLLCMPNKQACMGPRTFGASASKPSCTGENSDKRFSKYLFLQMPRAYLELNILVFGLLMSINLWSMCSH